MTSVFRSAHDDNDNEHNVEENSRVVDNTSDVDISRRRRSLWIQRLNLAPRTVSNSRIDDTEDSVMRMRTVTAMHDAASVTPAVAQRASIESSSRLEQTRSPSRSLASPDDTNVRDRSQNTPTPPGSPPDATRSYATGMIGPRLRPSSFISRSSSNSDPPHISEIFHLFSELHVSRHENRRHDTLHANHKTELTRIFLDLMQQIDDLNCVHQFKEFQYLTLCNTLKQCRELSLKIV